MISNNDRISYILLYRWSLEYLEAANSLSYKYERIRFQCLYLYSHAVELFLKSLLFKKERKIYYGHKISKYLNKCHDHGYHFSENFTFLVNRINQFNNDNYRLRYPKSGFICDVPNDPLEIDSIICEAFSQINSIEPEYKTLYQIHHKRRIKHDRNKAA